MIDSSQEVKKIIAFDLDGTLAESKQSLGLEMAELLAQLATRAKVVVISGGSFEQFKKQFLPFWKGPVNDLVMLPVDGSQCYEYEAEIGEWQLVDEQLFREDLKRKTIVALKDLIASHRYDIPPEHQIFGDYIEDRGSQITFSAYGQKAPIEVKEMWDSDQKKRLAIKAELEPLLPDIEIVIGGTTSIDFLSKGFNKATGLKRLLDRYELKVSDMLFVGDAVFPGGNDYSPSQVGIESVKIAGPQDTAEIIKKILSKKSVAFFCAEYGIQGLPLYAGGLGMLAEDFVREVGDQGIPFSAIGLFYNQRTEASSEELRSENRISLINHNFRLLRLANGEPMIVNVDVADSTICLQVWQRIHGSSRLYLLDTDTEKNSGDIQRILSSLYGSDISINILQQLLLGIGGVKLLRTLDIHPTVYHLNEGHTSFVALALFAEYIHDHPEMSLRAAVQMMKQHIVASKHTILSVAGINFSRDRLRGIVKHYFNRHRIDFEEFFLLGARQENPEMFSTTKFMLGSASRANGVSALHVEFEKKVHPHSLLIPITNGVYLPRWRTPGWPTLSLEDIDDYELWKTRMTLRTNLVAYIDSQTGVKLNPNTLIIVWARRFASYKRPEMLFSDLGRLAQIVEKADGPVHFIISGKAHKDDKEGQATVARIKEYVSRPEFLGKIVYVPEYSINVAKELVLGADVWLNTPIPGFEACGTSGMKAALNGALQCSTKDGWVGEVDWSGLGWILDDEHISTDIYDTIENKIVPIFYERDASGIPRNWISRIRGTVGLTEERYTATRMVKDYINKLYFPNQQ
ncbi:MAG: alpha-glucan family phosphorylase [Patescibacteria group bacterium]